MKEPNSKKLSNIRETLLGLGLIKDDSIEVFSENTVDKKDLQVFKDTDSKIIFIDNYYVGVEEYEEKGSRKEPQSAVQEVDGNLEDLLDTERRSLKYKQFIANKKICDFGCGKGSFLRASRQFAKEVVGVEIQKEFNDSLNKDGIRCFSKLKEIDAEMDAVFLFHCLEHLPNPSNILKEIHEKLKPDGEGKIIVEVPHARDLLLELNIEPFKKFTLWSQHLILHTRESLEAFLRDAGFKNIHIEGVQRYGLANHLNWLKNGKPGGHKNPLSIIETENLRNEYANSLSKINANDTLVAVATT